MIIVIVVPGGKQRQILLSSIRKIYIGHLSPTISFYSHINQQNKGISFV